MRHTSGLTYGNRGKSEIYKMYPESSNEASLTLTMDEFIDKLAKVPLLYQPGTPWEYSLSAAQHDRHRVCGLCREARASRPATGKAPRHGRGLQGARRHGAAEVRLRWRLRRLHGEGLRALRPDAVESRRARGRACAGTEDGRADDV